MVIVETDTADGAAYAAHSAVLVAASVDDECEEAAGELSRPITGMSLCLRLSKSVFSP
jgi:hypothetical protein